MRLRLSRQDALLLATELLGFEHPGLTQALERLEPEVGRNRLLSLGGGLAAPAQAVAEARLPGLPPLYRDLPSLVGIVTERLVSQRLVAGDQQRDEHQRGQQPAGSLGWVP